MPPHPAPVAKVSSSSDVSAGSLPEPRAEPPALPRGCSHLELRQADRVVSRHDDRYLAQVGLKTSPYALLGAERVAALHALLDECLQRMAEPAGETATTPLDEAAEADRTDRGAAVAAGGRR